MVVIIGILLILAFVFLLIFGKSTAEIRGEEGEKIVRKKLNRLDKNKYTIINDVVFNINGKKSQIDHIVVSDFGIFVIETKNYKGAVYGSESSYNWTQYLFKKQFKLYNPIKQNQGHIYALQHVLKGLMPLDFISIIVFTNRSKLKVKAQTHVIYTQKLIRVIKLYDEVSLNNYMKEAIIETIKKHNIKDNN
ncbi:nuclease-related domain-containing protein [Faecalibacter bovis]|uniref:NERD domain-containing protein n=1 Tax=Faecalibacter bovis TaxID=2898187 RepID=A0ABX7XD49_9FLAO|nr:nuclease-related domain-containing protein [Faecalibacter bovis]QTV05795.1 NERD domain-containing protein [Faecalibacter bovis]